MPEFENWSVKRPPRSTGVSLPPELSMESQKLKAYLQEFGDCWQTEERLVFKALLDHRSERLSQPDIPKGRDWEKERLEEQAKKICQGCGVLAECIEYALPRVEPAGYYGIIAGLNKEELAAMAIDLEVEQLDGGRVRGYKAPAA